MSDPIIVEVTPAVPVVVDIAPAATVTVEVTSGPGPAGPQGDPGTPAPEIAPPTWTTGTTALINEIWVYAGNRYRRNSSTQPPAAPPTGWSLIGPDRGPWLPTRPAASGDSGKVLTAYNQDARWSALPLSPALTEGAGTPVGNVFPNKPGEFYFDTTAGDMYYAPNWEIGDWRKIVTE